MDKSKIYENNAKEPTERDEWHTPISIINYVKSLCNGVIHLDPATTLKRAKIMGIESCYTKEDNGLEQPWYGTVWLNPPFSSKTDWIIKAKKELKSVKYTELGANIRIFILLPNSISTKIIQEHILKNCIIHIPNKRINFIDGKTNQLMKGVPFESCIFELTKTPNQTYKLFNISDYEPKEKNND